MISYPEYNTLTSTIIGCAIQVHRQLGPGLLESLYQRCLVKELQHNNLAIQSQLGLPVIYRGEEMEHGYRVDILVEGVIVLELKTVDSISKVHCAQILTYMKLGNFPIGYLLNFDVLMMKEGIKRFVR